MYQHHRGNYRIPCRDDPVGRYLFEMVGWELKVPRALVKSWYAAGQLKTTMVDRWGRPWFAASDVAAAMKRLDVAQEVAEYHKGRAKRLARKLARKSPAL